MPCTQILGFKGVHKLVAAIHSFHQTLWVVTTKLDNRGVSTLFSNVEGNHSVINHTLIVKLVEETFLLVGTVNSPRLDSNKTSGRWWEFFGSSGNTKIGRVDIGFAVVALVPEFHRVGVHNTRKSRLYQRVLVIHVHALRGRLSIIKHFYGVWFCGIIQIRDIAWLCGALAGEDAHLVLLRCKHEWVIGIFGSCVRLQQMLSSASSVLEVGIEELTSLWW